MSGYPWVWIVALLVAAGAAGLLIWRGRAGDVSVGAKGLSVHVAQPPATDTAVVADNAEIQGEVDSITGRNIQGQAAHAGDSRTDVARHLVVGPGGKVGAITGINQTSGAPANRKRTT